MSGANSRVVVVTGASGGIGRASARAFAKRGDKVALIARGESGLEAARRDVEKAGGTALVIAEDVVDPDAVEATSRAPQLWASHHHGAVAGIAVATVGATVGVVRALRR